MAINDSKKRQEEARFTYLLGKGGVDSGLSFDKKMEFLEALIGKVRNRGTRRWLNDRILMELVPPMSAKEIQGLFAPPPWGGNVRPSTFSMTDIGDLGQLSSVDVEKEAKIIGPGGSSASKRKSDEITVLHAWRRIQCRTREALRRSTHAHLIEGYEECIRSFISNSKDEDILVLRVQDPFHRLLLHGVCEFYNLDSLTVIEPQDGGATRMTRISRKKKGRVEVPDICLAQFLKISKEGGAC